MRPVIISSIRRRFQRLSRSRGQVTHVLLTRSPLINPASWASSFDLHVLSTPPAFVLSQDQTLRKKQSSKPGTPKGTRQTNHTKTTPHPRAGRQSRHHTSHPTRQAPGMYQKNKQTAPTPTHAPTPKRQAHDQTPGPTWHQKLGTLLSSQRTDTHR